MKKLLLFTMLFALSFSYAQEKNKKLNIKKGTWSLSGETSFSFNNNKADNQVYEDKSYLFNFAPKIGYTISDNLILGVGIGYGYGDSKSTNPSNTYERKNYSMSIFPYIKKHFSVGKKVTLSLQGEFKYSHTKYEDEQNNSLNNNDSKTNAYSIGIRPGITYFLNKKLALEANLGFLGYTRTNYDNNSYKGNNSSFNFNFNPSNLMFGLSYYW